MMEKSAASDACLPSLPTMPTPTSAAWIMLTSLPPSPMQHTRFPEWALTRYASSAFWMGDTRQAMTVGRREAIVMNSWG
jgi:hypothetical protein